MLLPTAVDGSSAPRPDWLGGTVTAADLDSCPVARSQASPSNLEGRRNIDRPNTPVARAFPGSRTFCSLDIIRSNGRSDSRNSRLSHRTDETCPVSDSRFSRLRCSLPTSRDRLSPLEGSYGIERTPSADFSPAVSGMSAPNLFETSLQMYGGDVLFNLGGSSSGASSTPRSATARRSG